MKRNYRIKIILMVLLLTGGVSAAMAQDEEKPDLDEMYRQLDEAIEKSPQYVALRQEQINKLCKSFYEASAIKFFYVQIFHLQIISYYNQFFTLKTLIP